MLYMHTRKMYTILFRRLLFASNACAALRNIHTYIYTIYTQIPFGYSRTNNTQILQLAVAILTLISHLSSLDPFSQALSPMLTNSTKHARKTQLPFTLVWVDLWM